MKSFYSHIAHTKNKLIKLNPFYSTYEALNKRILLNERSTCKNKINYHLNLFLFYLVVEKTKKKITVVVMVADNKMQSRFDGISSDGVGDQYADGRAAKVWEIFIGDKSSRTENYKNFLIELLRRKGCHRILDVACGTG